MADHHPAGMLSEMARQILNLSPEPAERLNDGMLKVEPDFAQVALERFLRVDPFEMIHDLGQPVDLGGLERQRLADFAGGAAAAVGDDIRGHCYPRPFGGYPRPFRAYPRP